VDSVLKIGQTKASGSCVSRAVYSTRLRGWRIGEKALASDGRGEFPFAADHTLGLTYPERLERFL
jgi:hypothetical protein